MAKENQSFEEFQAEKVGLKTKMDQMFVILEKLVEQRNAEANLVNNQTIGQPVVVGPVCGSTAWPTYGLPPGYIPPIVEEGPIHKQPIPQVDLTNVDKGPTHMVRQTPIFVGTQTQAVHRRGLFVNNAACFFASDTQDKDKEKLDMIEERLKAIEGARNLRLKDAFERCLVPGVVLPPKFKLPEFEKYNGTTCPNTHLHMYVRKMSAYHKDDKLLIHCFQDSLVGTTLNWYIRLEKENVKTFRDLANAFVQYYEYNEDLAPDRTQLQNMFHKENESFKEYTQRWRAVAAQVWPHIEEDKQISIFIETLQNPYYDHMLNSISSDFATLRKVGERIDNGLRCGKILSDQVRSDAKEGLSFARKEEGEAHSVSNKEKGFRRSDHKVRGINNNAYAFRPLQTQNRPKRHFDPIPMTYAKLYEYLLKHDVIKPIHGITPSLNPPPPWYKADQHCAYHMDVEGHSLEGCLGFKHQVQNLTDRGFLKFEVSTPDANNNPLPEHTN